MPEEYKNPAAVALGRLSKGVPKTVTDEDREARRLRMMALNAVRKRLLESKKLRETLSKQAVKDRADVGLFTPIQPFE